MMQNQVSRCLARPLYGTLSFLILCYRCLQRQVCHLQYHIQVQDHHLSELRQVRCHLSQCQSENEALKCTCSQLSAKNQICATENQEYNHILLLTFIVKGELPVICNSALFYVRKL